MDSTQKKIDPTQQIDSTQSLIGVVQNPAPSNAKWYGLMLLSALIGACVTYFLMKKMKKDESL